MLDGDNRKSGGFPMFTASLAFAICLTMVGTGATAQSIEDAHLAFTEGRFLDAADLAEAVGTPDGLVLAARALVVYTQYQAAEGDRRSLYQRAIRLGEEAVRADPRNPDAHLHAASAIGRYAQHVGAMAAGRMGLAGRIRARLETVLSLDPDHSTGHLGLGAWHAGIVDAGRLARIMYGGNREEATSHLNRALELAPDSKDVLLEVADWLPVLEGEEGKAQAKELLIRAAAIPARDAWEELLQKATETRLAELESGSSP